MDSTQAGKVPHGPLATLRSAVTDGVDRYRALREAPEAARLLATAALSYIGDRFNTIALIALAFELGNSALGVGGMMALLALPRLVVQAPAGVLVDRFPGKRLLIVSQLLMAIIAGSFALLAIVPSLWLLYGLTLAMGIVRTVDIPAFEVRLMALTSPERRGTANSVHMLAMTGGEIIGPLLGGVVLALTGATPLFLINALSFLIVARMIASLPARVAAAEPDPEPVAADETDASVTAPALGYRTLLARSDVRLYVAALTASCVLLLGAIPLYITRALDLGLGEGGVGLFYATMGVGSLIGGVLAGTGTYSSTRAFAISALAAMIGAVCMIAFGAAGSLVLALLALAVYGMIGDVEEISALTYFQNTLPEGVFGRFFALFLMCTGVGGVVGALGGPALAEAFGTGVALTILAVPVLVLAALFGIREGGLRLALPPFAPVLEPEVVGHGLFGVPSPSDLIPDRAAGGALHQPRLHRLV
jgi:MFS family permease